MKKHKVLVVGGGFGGIKTALELSGDERMDIKLISDRESFQYFPTLYHTATGGLTAQSIVSLKAIFANKPVEVVIDRAKTLDRRAHTLTTEGGETYEYDDIVLSLGVVTNYFGIEGLAEYSYGIKSIEEIEKLKHHIHQQLIDERKPDMHYIIVGGGPTGVELAGALPSYLSRIMRNHGIKTRNNIHVDLVEAAPRIMPRMSKHVSRAFKRRLQELGVRVHTGKAVQGATADALMVGGKPIRSHTIIWTAGMTNNPFYAENKFAFGPRGKVAVNVYLQADDNVYVIGDNANTPYSGMAQTAISDARFVASNLKRAVSGKSLLPYRPKMPVYVTPVGHGWASVQYKNLTFSGWLGSALRSAADAAAFAELEPIPVAAKHWFTEFGEQESCATCKAAVAIMR